MTEDKQGFAVHVGELEMVANKFLPEVSTGLGMIPHIIPENTRGKGAYPAASDLASALENYIFAVGRRQGAGCARIDETAAALADIVRLYRRADGQV
jgi:hypothetical protein